jgi:hypothetical protein
MTGLSAAAQLGEYIETHPSGYKQLFNTLLFLNSTKIQSAALENISFEKTI